MKLKETTDIVDCHSHFFPNAFGPDSDPSVYLRETEKIGVFKSIISASPTPRQEYNGKTYFPCIWRWSDRDNRFKYFSIIKNSVGNIISEVPAPTNPFHEVNQKLLQYIRGTNDGSKEIFMAYLYHPILDTSDELESFLKEPLVKALKIHGVSTATTTQDIPKYMVELVKRYNKPIIAHTDYSSTVNTPINRLYRRNNSLDWINWSLRNNVPLLVTHGARLSESAIKVINSSDNIILGCSPDLMLKEETERLETLTDASIFDFIVPRINPKKLVYDIDFGWNVFRRNQWQDNDWSSSKRLEETLFRYNAKNLISIVLRENAIRFFRLDK